MFLFATTFFLGCGDTTTDTGDIPLNCSEDSPSPYPVGTSSWEVITEEEVYNQCENDAGNGPHIHLDEVNTLDFVEEGDCLHTTASASFPADMEGLHDGTSFELTGGFIEEFGACELQVDATLTGTLSDADHFEYTFHLEVTDLNEFCAITVGEEEAHTYKALPCELSWTGPGTRLSSR